MLYRKYTVVVVVNEARYKIKGEVGGKFLRCEQEGSLNLTGERRQEGRTEAGGGP